MMRKIQIDSKNYIGLRYNHKVRWMNFWHQVREISNLADAPAEVLEIGKGSGLVSKYLRKMGYVVTTLDIDKTVKPDILASVEDIPTEDGKFDLVLSAEVLEHLPYEEAPKALREIRRVTKKSAVISLPYAGSYFKFFLKIPKFPEIDIFIPIPYFWKKHKVTKEHYWEVGKKGFSVKKIKALIERAGFEIKKSKVFRDDFDHIFFVLKK